MSDDDALLAEVLRDLLRGEVSLTWETPGPPGAVLRLEGRAYVSRDQAAALQRAHRQIESETVAV